MKKTSTQFFVFMLLLLTGKLLAQPTPELLYYRFDGSGTTVPNLASNPPAGTATATIMGSITQGAGGQCGGALIGSGNSSSSDYLNTGYAPNLTGSWTISMYTKDITASSTLFYIFGDVNSGSFRCFTNGVAGPNNWILRGTGITDTYINGGATVAPHVTTFVYDVTTNNIYGYLDGVLVTTVAQTAPSISGTGPFKVMGYSSNVGSPAGGKLDEFRMYDRALTAAEVATLMYPATYSTINPMACTSYTSPAGNTYTTSGTYTDTIPNSGGCDSIITINLTVNQPSSNTLLITACGSYPSPAGNTYTSSGTYIDHLTNAAGCDSAITINLTILQPTYSSLTASSCDLYTSPAGNFYMTSGIYSDTLPNSVGCDSIITINLTINNSSSSTINPFACDSYQSPAGNTYTSSGTYTDVIPNATGCDSTITINLTVMNSSSSAITAATCGPYTAPSGAIYTTSGTYTDIIPNAAGCDSTITIVLAVNSVTANVTQNNATLTSTNTGVTYQWIDCSNNAAIAGATSQSYTATANGSYAVVVSNGNCADTSSCLAVTGIGIQENGFANAVKLYPNPSDGQFTLELGQSYADVMVTITDLSGRRVFEQKYSSSDRIAVSLEQPAGMYLVQITADENSTVVKYTKE